MFPHVAKQLERRVLIRRHNNFCQRGRFFPHCHLYSRHCSGLNIKALCEESDGGENELRLRLHIHAQGIVAVFIGGRADFRSPEMDVDVRNGFARHLIDNLADNNCFDGETMACAEYKAQSTKYYFELAG